MGTLLILRLKKDSGLISHLYTRIFFFIQLALFSARADGGRRDKPHHSVFNKNMDIKSLLMPLEEYAKTRWPESYKFKIKTRDGGELFYFGVSHYRDPKNPLFAEIKKEFEEFKPDLVFIEGMRTLRTKDRDWEIRNLTKLQGDGLILGLGESGFVGRLAIDSNAFLDSPEPNFQDEINHHLDTGFSKDELFGYYMIRFIRQRFRIPEPRPTAEKLAAQKSQELRKDTGWEDFDFNVEHFKSIAQKIWGSDFDIESENLGMLIRPNSGESKDYKETVINKIAEASWRFRDEYIVGEIVKAFQKYKRLFVVYGFSHAVVQEPALRQLLF